MPDKASLNCPRCREKMANTTRDGIEAHTCLYCNGVWVSGAALDGILARENNPPAKSALLAGCKHQSDNTANRHCPTCQHETLYQVASQGVELDLCPRCNGLFFDEGELKQVLPGLQHTLEKSGCVAANLIEGLLCIMLSLFTW
jgi:Zn-finger nucleic acid-binding protein